MHNFQLKEDQANSRHFLTQVKRKMEEIKLKCENNNWLAHRSRLETKHVDNVTCANAMAHFEEI